MAADILAISGSGIEHQHRAGFGRSLHSRRTASIRARHVGLGGHFQTSSNLRNISEVHQWFLAETRQPMISRVLVTAENIWKKTWVPRR
jgi:hypothetical protein